MAEDYYDFDAAWEAEAAKKRTEPVRAKIKNRLYDLPDQIPAKVILTAVKMQKRGAKNLDIDEVLDSIGMMVGGRAAAEQMMADGIAIHQLMDVMNKCMTLIRDGVGTEGEVDAPAPTGAPTPFTAS